MKQVNVVNETDQPAGGSVEIIDPTGDIVLDETFDLVLNGASVADDDEKNSAAVDSDVWTRNRWVRGQYRTREHGH